MLKGMEALKELQRRFEIKRGDIWMVNIPKEARNAFGNNIQIGLRPCVVISGEGNNKHANIVNILPISSKINKVYPQHTEITYEEDLKDCGLPKRSIVLTEQMMTIDKNRLTNKLGRANNSLMGRIEKGMDIQQGKNLRNTKENLIKINTNKFNLKKAFNQIEMINKAKELDAELFMYLHNELKEYCEKHDVKYYDIMNKYNNRNNTFKFNSAIMSGTMAMSC